VGAQLRRVELRCGGEKLERWRSVGKRQLTEKSVFWPAASLGAAASVVGRSHGFSQRSDRLGARGLLPSSMGMTRPVPAGNQHVILLACARAMSPCLVGSGPVPFAQPHVRSVALGNPLASNTFAAPLEVPSIWELRHPIGPADTLEIARLNSLSREVPWLQLRECHPLALWSYPM